MKNKINSKAFSKKDLLPLACILSVVPLIVYNKVYYNLLFPFDWMHRDAEYEIDFFLYWKGAALIVISACMIVILIHKAAFKFSAAEEGLMFSFLAIYTVLIILSSIFSDYPRISFTGVRESFEPCQILISYVVICFYSSRIDWNKTNMEYVEKWLLAGCGIMCLIGILQFAGQNPFEWSFVQKLTSSRQLHGSLEYSINSDTVYMTLFNSNYVGTYVVMIVPILLPVIFSQNKRGIRILAAVAAITLLICLLGSQAKNGVLTIVILFFFLTLGFRKYLRKYRLVYVLVLLAVVAVPAIFNYYSKGSLISSIQNLFHFDESEAKTYLENIETEKDCVRIYYDKHILQLQYEPSGTESITLHLSDENGNEVAYETDYVNGNYVPDNQIFASMVIRPLYIDDLLSLGVMIDGREWYFTNQKETDGYYYLNPEANFAKIEEAEVFPFLKGKEEIFSGRGYIWSRAIPLLKDTLLLGSGADTFAIRFPQHDYVAMYQHGYGNTLIGRAHNLYLQTGIQSGVAALICFLAFYFIYAVQSINMYIMKASSNMMEIRGLCYFIGSLGYMITGLTNDSLPVTSPIFWCITGIGIALNHNLKNNGGHKSE